jgi:hypothetical protein
MKDSNFNPAKLLDKIHRLTDDELIKDQDWSFISTNHALIYELLKIREFTYLNLLPPDIFQSDIICLLLIEYKNPPIQLIPETLFNETFFICATLDNNYTNITNIPHKYLTDNILQWFCQKFGDKSKILNFIPKELLNKDLAKLLVTKNSSNFTLLEKEFRNDIEIYNLIPNKSKKDIFPYAGINIKKNPYLVIQILEESPEYFPLVDASLKNTDFFLRQLKHIPNLLQYAGPIIQDNEHCVWETVKVMPQMLYYASNRLLNIPSFALQLSLPMSTHAIELSFGAWGESVTSHKDTIMELIPQLCASSKINLIHKSLRSDFDIMFKIINIDPYWFSVLSSPLNCDPSFLHKCYYSLLEQDQYTASKYNRANKLFEKINESCFYQSEYLVYLYDNFNSIFSSTIYNAISHHNTELIQEMKTAHTISPDNLINFMNKIKLHDSLEKQLQTNSLHIISPKI